MPRHRDITDRQRATLRREIFRAAELVRNDEARLKAHRQALDDAMASAVNDWSLPVSHVAEAAHVSRQTVYTAAKRHHEFLNPGLPFE
jgi:hypothetical protein